MSRYDLFIFVICEYKGINIYVYLLIKGIICSIYNEKNLIIIYVI